MWYWGGVIRQWGQLFVLLLAIGLAWEYRTHQAATLFIATVGGFIVTILIGLPRRKPKAVSTGGSNSGRVIPFPEGEAPRTLRSAYENQV